MIEVEMNVNERIGLRGCGRRLAAVALMLLAAGCLPGAETGGAVSTAGAAQTNVYVLVIDCLRADHVGAYGYHRVTTPNLDRFAADAVLFRQAISQSTFTKSSIASLFTSRHPHQHGVYSGSREDAAGAILSDTLPESEVTLAEVLAEHGYHNVGLLQQVHLQDYMGFAQGFHDYDAQAGRIYWINKRFRQSILKRREGVFAYLHYIDLHDPYRPRPPYDTMFGVHSPDIYEGIDFANWGKELRRIYSGDWVLTEQDLEQLVTYYDGLIRFIDAEIGKLFEFLRRHGLYDDALIIVTSDHGDAFWEHGFVAHSNTPYEYLIHVPLLVKFPGQRLAGRKVDAQVRLIDVMPTVLDELGLPSDAAPMAGYSLLKHLTESPPADAPNIAISEVAYNVNEDYPRISIRTEELKYLHFKPPRSDQMFAIREDPGERNDVLAAWPEEAAAFRAKALEMVAAFRNRDQPAAAVDATAIEQLRALGYVE